MKKLFTFLASITLSVMLFAQAPQSFSYQTVIRDASWTVLDNQSVGIKISILEDVSTGNVVYEETHSATTSAIGLVNLSVGGGVVMTGVFNTIDWGNHNYFIEVAVDVTGGTSYIVMGTTQLRSVPYALYAETSGTPGTPGPQGIAGADGADGVDGIDGTNGTNGLDGNDGAPGIQGVAGATGNPGTNGTNGLPGADGTNGTNGLPGADGTNGTNGLPGADGTNGADGIDGTNGTDGVDGLPGVDGTNGVDGNDGVDGIDGINAVVDYDSLANLISADSAFIANLGGSSSSNSAMGITSAVDLNDFDFEYDMFDTQFSSGLTNTSTKQIDIDPNNNIWILGEYNAYDGASIAGVPLQAGSSNSGLFLAVYDSSGLMLDVFSDPLLNMGSRMSMDIDDNGYVFISFQNQTTYPYNFCIRKFHLNGSSNIVQDFNYSPLSSTGTNGSGQTVVYDITSDKYGGIYIVGFYSGETYFSPSCSLTTITATYVKHSFILRMDGNLDPVWAETDFCPSCQSARMLSVISNNNDEVYTSGNINTGNGDIRKFIHKYSSGTLGGTSFIDSIYSSNVQGFTNDENNSELACDSNDDVYLFTGMGQYLSFNNITVNSTVSNCLFKFSSSLVPLSAISLQNYGASSINNLEISSSNNVILHTVPYDFEINNIRYSTLNGQNHNVIKIDSNHNFIRNFYVGNGGSPNTSILDVSANSDNVVMLFYREGSFINNGTTYQKGCYVVREEY